MLAWGISPGFLEPSGSLLHRLVLSFRESFPCSFTNSPPSLCPLPLPLPVFPLSSFRVLPVTPAPILDRCHLPRVAFTRLPASSAFVGAFQAVPLTIHFNFSLLAYSCCFEFIISYNVAFVFYLLSFEISLLITFIVLPSCLQAFPLMNLYFYLVPSNGTKPL